MKTKSAEIVRLGKDLQYVPILRFKTFDGAIKQLNRMAEMYGWTYRRDMSLFGGYYVAPTGVCYSVR